MSCKCPRPAALPTVTSSPCEVDWSRVQKFAICREVIWQSATSSEASTVSELAELAEWVTVLAASDDTKWMISPIIGEFIATPGEAETAEFDGQTRNTGNYLPTTITFQTQGASSSDLAVLDDLTCEPNLSIILFDNDEGIIHGLNGTVINGFPLATKTFQITDMGQPDAGGFIIANGGFQLLDGWSKNTTVTNTAATDFNPLLDLSN